MPDREHKESLRYVDKAFLDFTEIMSCHQNDMLENINRTTKGELFVLQFLTERDTTVLPSELSAALCASPARISALLRNLEKKGQIERDINKSNRRNVLVTITEGGRERVKIETKRMKKSVTRVFAEMGEEDAAEFIRLAKRFFEISQKNIGCWNDKGDF